VRGEEPPPVAFNVVPDNERLVPNVISSIIPVPAVPLPISLLVAIDVEMTGAVPPDDVIGLVAVTPVTVPPLEGLVLVIVKLGYVPVTDIPVPLFNTTVWSGAVLVIVMLGVVVGLATDADIPVPLVTETLVTLPVPAVMLTSVTPVILPLLSTVICGTCVELPYVLAVTPVVVSVAVRSDSVTSRSISAVSVIDVINDAPPVAAIVTPPEPLSVIVMPEPCIRLSNACDGLSTLLVCNSNVVPPPIDCESMSRNVLYLKYSGRDILLPLKKAIKSVPFMGTTKNSDVLGVAIIQSYVTFF
jgi:hypothetical protein